MRTLILIVLLFSLSACATPTSASRQEAARMASEPDMIHMNDGRNGMIRGDRVHMNDGTNGMIR